MWELVCHHSYDWNGLPIDRSVYDSHGERIGVEVLADGATPGSGALRFQGADRVAVATGGPPQPNPGWQPLQAIRIECTLRLTDPNQVRRTLIEGDRSFRLFIFQGGVWAVHAGRADDPGIFFGVFGWHGFENDGLSTVSDGVGPPYQVPLGQWVTLVFEHDGIGWMRLFADGALIAQRFGVKAGIRSPGARGVSIGNSIDGIDDVLGGDIDEIKVWRRDPRAMWNDFVQRPIDEAAADCWHDFLLRMAELLREHPDCARLLLAGVGDALDRTLRRMAAHGPGALRRLDELQQDYRRLWRAGTIDGPEMAALAAALQTLLRGLGLDPTADGAFLALLHSDCFKRMVEAAPRLDCDPAFVGMLRILAGGSGRRPVAAI
ncbi:MAG: LamG-like jellyroll fold domain-containing protein [Alphaproteobacteria bacterium]